MAYAQEVDCFHDSTEEEDTRIVDVEWSKLKSSHKKEGYRVGHSAGQEAVLQDAFNRGFVCQVQLEASASFYKGILWALKTFSERSKTSKITPSITLSAEVESRISSLLDELSVMCGGNNPISQITNSSKVDEEGSIHGISESCYLQNPEGSIAHGQASQCNPAECDCLSSETDGNASHSRSSKPKGLTEGTFEYYGQNSKRKQAVDNCKNLLEELGLEKLLYQPQF